MDYAEAALEKARRLEQLLDAGQVALFGSFEQLVALVTCRVHPDTSWV